MIRRKNRTLHASFDLTRSLQNNGNSDVGCCGVTGSARWCLSHLLVPSRGRDFCREQIVIAQGLCDDYFDRIILLLFVRLLDHSLINL